MTRLLVLSLFVTSTFACGDDGSTPADDTGSGTEPGPTSTAPMTVTEGASSTGDGTSSSATTDGESSGGSSDTGASASETSTGADSTGGESTDGTGSSGDESTSAGACAPITFTIVDEPGFTGDGFCEGVQANAVLGDADAVSDHNAEWCASVAACIFPEPPCDPVPALPAEGEQIVYVFGVENGCSALATITEVLDCGDSVEVHYSIIGGGMCGTIVHAWTAAAIPASDADIVFVPG